jgi:hypothetical protein
MENGENLINDLFRKYQQHKGKRTSEMATRTIFINPVLSALGWDFSNLEMVKQEFTIRDSKRVDYAFFIRGKINFLLEAKPVDKAINDCKEIYQINDYAQTEKVKWYVITNGIRWRIFYTTEKEHIPNNQLFELSICDDYNEGHGIGRMIEKFDYISSLFVKFGSLMRLTKKRNLDDEIVNAFYDMVRNRDLELENFIQRKLKIQLLSPDDIHSSLMRIIKIKAEIDDDFDPTESEVNITSQNKIPITKLLRVNKSVSEQFDNIDNYIKNILSIKSRQEKLNVINYKCDGTTFCSVDFKDGILNIYLKLACSDYTNYSEFIRDSKSFHPLGKKGIVISIKDEKHLKAAYDLIKAALSEVKGIRTNSEDNLKP